MEYLVAGINDLDEIINLKNEVKKRIKEENLQVWLGDYPQDELLTEEIKDNRGRIIKDNNEIVAYAALHEANIEYDSNTFCNNDLYSFSRIMTSTKSLGKGYAKVLINKMFEEVKDKTYGFGLIVDDCNSRAINLYLNKGFIFEGYSKQIYGDFYNYTYYYNKDYTDNLNYELAKLSSLKTQLFNKRIFNTKYKILGVKIPDLRKFSKNLDLSFYDNIKYKCIEDLLLGTILLKRLKGEDLKREILNILEYTDSWVVTDSIGSNIDIKDNLDEYFSFVEELILSEKEFFVRAGIDILLSQYKNYGDYDKIFKLILKVKLNTYYVNMALAWLLCEFSFKDERVLAIINSFSKEVIKMFNQKRRDSLRLRR